MTRFRMHELEEIHDAMRRPRCFVVETGDKFSSFEALVIFLTRLHRSDCWEALVPSLGSRNLRGYRRVFKIMVDYVYDRFAWCISYVSRWKNYLLEWAAILDSLGLAEQGVVGFVDGTARRMCRPTVLEDLMHNGYYKYHGLKYVCARASSCLSFTARSM